MDGTRGADVAGRGDAEVPGRRKGQPWIDGSGPLIADRSTAEDVGRWARGYDAWG